MPIRLLGSGMLLLLLSVALLAYAPLQYWDHHLIALFANYRSPELTWLAQALAWLGGMPVVLSIAVVCCLLQIQGRHYRHIGLIVGTVLGSICLSWLLKFMIDRPRPDAIWAIFKSYGDSFPSGHSLYAASYAALIVLFTQSYPKRHIYFAFAGLWLLMMGLSRIYLGVHYLSDVLAGWALGLIWVSLLWQWIHKAFPLNTLEQTQKLNN